MAITETDIDAFVARYVSSNQVISLGTGEHSVTLLKKIALRIEEGLLKNIQLIPTSHTIAVAASSLGIPLGNIDELDIDAAIEFADAADSYFNYVKNETTSLVRDKMIAQNAKELTVIVERKSVMDRLSGKVCFEISQFGYKKTLEQLQTFGEASIRLKGKESFKTESGHLLVDVKIDAIFDLDEIETASKRIPGVIETSIFAGYADRLITHNGKIEAKSRMNPPEELRI